MIDTHTLRLLNSRSAAERERAIKALAQSKDPDALPHLAKVYQNDPEPTLRELARKAGVYIRKYSSPSEDSLPLMSSAYDYEDDDSRDDDSPLTPLDADSPVIEEKTKNKPVSEAAQERARGLVSQALDASMRGDQERAYKLVRQALKKDPGVGRDSYSRRALESITGLPYERAREEFTVGRYAGRTGGSSDDPTWGDALVDLAIYWVVAFGINMLTLLVAIGIVAPMRSTITDPAVLQQFDMQMALLTSSSTFVGMMLQSVLYATIAVIALLVMYFLWHLVATVMLGGEGSFTNLIRKCTLLMAMYSPVLIVALVAIVLIGVFVLQPEQFLPFYSLSMFALAIGSVLILSQRIGKAYQFGMGRGCATLILSYVLAVCGCASLFYILGNSALMLIPAMPTP